MRILETYNFENQTTYGITGQIKTATLLGNNRLAIANETYIEIFDIEERAAEPIEVTSSSTASTATDLAGVFVSHGDDDDLPTIQLQNLNLKSDQNQNCTTNKRIFSTFGDINELIYCKIGNYLLSLEKFISFENESSNAPQKNHNKNQDKYNNKNDNSSHKVLIYTNIMQLYNKQNSKCNNEELPLIIPRIAAKVTPNAKVNGIEMIELEIDEPPDLVTCCQETGNILVKSKFHLYLFEYRECINEAQHFHYIDFFEFPFYLELNFLPKQISFIENVIACTDQKQCIVFKILKRNTKRINDDGGNIINNDMDCCGDDPDEDNGGYSYTTTTTSATTTELTGTLNSSIGLASDNNHIAGIYKENSLEKKIICNEPQNCITTEIDDYSQSFTNKSKDDFDTDSLEYPIYNINNNININNCNDKLRMSIDVSKKNPINYDELIKKSELEDCGLTSTWDQINIKNYSIPQTDSNTSCSYIVGGGNGGTSAIITQTTDPTVEDHPIRANDLKVKLITEKYNSYSLEYNNKTFNKKFEIKKMLQIQMASLKYQQKIRIGETFTCFDLKAIYKNNINNDSSNNTIELKHCSDNLMQSKRYDNCIGFNFIITTTAADGYLYQFCNHGNWYRENEKPLTKYQFTAQVLSIILSDFVVHAVTRETVETVTSRIGHKLFSSYYEYPMLSDPFPNESAATTDMQIFCMKLHSFCNTQFILKSDKYLVLISKCPIESHKENDTDLKMNLTNVSNRNTFYRKSFTKKSKLIKQESIEWTVYNLKMPDPIRLADDLVISAKETLKNGRAIFEAINNFGNNNKNNSLRQDTSTSCIAGVDDTITTNNLSTTTATHDLVYELLTEANIILRLAKNLDLNYTQEFVEKVENMFQQNCKFLADFVIQSEKEDQYSEAIGYYRMSKTQPYSIYENFFENFKNSDELNNQNKIIGLKHAMKMFIDCFAKKRPECDFLYEAHEPILHTEELDQKISIKKFLNKSSTIEDHMKIEIPFGYELFKFFHFYDQALLTILGLKSIPFLDCNISNYLKYFESKDLSICTHNEILLYSLSLSRGKNSLLALIQLEKMTRTQLYLSLKFAWQIIFDDNFNPDDCKDETFSEFTEKILFRTEKSHLIESVGDVFLYYLCITNKIGIKFFIDLFLNYFALHIENCSNNSSINGIPRKICEIVLGGYFYDLFGSIVPGINENLISTLDCINDEYNNSKKSSLTVSPQQSTDQTCGCDDSTEDIIIESDIIPNENASISSNEIKLQKLNIQLTNKIQNQQIINTENSETKALILLLRLYLGNLAIATKKFESIKTIQEEDNQKRYDEILAIRIQCISELTTLLVQNKLSVIKWNKFSTAKRICDGGGDQQEKYYEEITPKLIPNYSNDSKNPFTNYIRPIACLNERADYLNHMEPFKLEHFINKNFIGHDDEVVMWVLKIQCLLNSRKTDCLLSDFIKFIQKNPQLIGIDSFISILLPIDSAIKFLTAVNPESLYDFGDYYKISNDEFRSILTILIAKIRELECLPVDDYTNKLIEQYHKALERTLEHLYKGRTFESFLNCLPVEEVSISGKFILRKKSKDQQPIDEEEDQSTSYTIDSSHYVMDSVDESNIFQMFLRKCLARQRVEALQAMIESTGKQLFEAAKNSQLNLN